jgi:hypothetical protein
MGKGVLARLVMVAALAFAPGLWCMCGQAKAGELPAHAGQIAKAHECCRRPVTHGRCHRRDAGKKDSGKSCSHCDHAASAEKPAAKAAAPALQPMLMGQPVGPAFSVSHDVTRIFDAAVGAGPPVESLRTLSCSFLI